MHLAFADFRSSLEFDQDDRNTKNAWRSIRMGRLNHSFSSKKPLNVGVSQLHPCRTAMIALARSRSDLHFAQQGIHFRDGQDASCANRSMASHCCKDMVEFLAQAERSAKLGD